MFLSAQFRFECIGGTSYVAQTIRTHRVCWSVLECFGDIALIRMRVSALRLIALIVSGCESVRICVCVCVCVCIKQNFPKITYEWVCTLHTIHINIASIAYMKFAVIGVRAAKRRQRQSLGVKLFSFHSVHAHRLRAHDFSTETIFKNKLRRLHSRISERQWQKKS